MAKRFVVLDTETTGLEVRDGHRIIEIGCVEVVDRTITERQFHYYINPQRKIDQGAIEVHGISNAFLQDKPLFAQLAEEFLSFIQDAELIIHNAPFDVGFLDMELQQAGLDQTIADVAKITDSLVMARDMHPGLNNSLDALCKRYFIDNSQRELHGALLDAQILAEVYLAMTGGQTSLSLPVQSADDGIDERELEQLGPLKPAVVFNPSAEDLTAHQQLLLSLKNEDGGAPSW